MSTPADTVASEHRPLWTGLQRVADLEIDGTHPLWHTNNAISLAREILRDLSTARTNGDAEGVLFCAEDARQLLFDVVGPDGFYGPKDPRIAPDADFIGAGDDIVVFRGVYRGLTGILANVDNGVAAISTGIRTGSWTHVDFADIAHPDAQWFTENA